MCTFFESRPDRAGNPRRADCQEAGVKRSAIGALANLGLRDCPKIAIWAPVWLVSIKNRHFLAF